MDWSGVSRTIVDKWKELVLVSSGTQGTECWPVLLLILDHRVLCSLLVVHFSSTSSSRAQSIWEEH